MSLLDSVLGGLLGGNSSASPMQGILGSLLGGGGGPAQGQQSGIAGLLGRFQQAGLGDVAKSWVGTGPNQQVRPEQLQNVFGQDQVNQWSQQSGMAPHDLLGQLAQFLPHAVDRMTPNGQVPQGGGSPFDEAGVELPGGNRFG